MSIGMHRRERLLGSSYPSGVLSTGQRGFIKSIQSGTVTLTGVTSNTAAITSVVPANSLLVWIGCTYSADTDPDTSSSAVRIDLTSATVVTGTKTSASNTAIASFQVIEYWPGILKSVQRSIVTINAATSATATITAVNVAKSTLTLLGWSTNQVNGYWARMGPRLALTDATTVTGTKGIATESIVAAFQVAEYY